MIKNYVCGSSSLFRGLGDRAQTSFKGVPSFPSVRFEDLDPSKTMLIKSPHHN